LLSGKLTEFASQFIRWQNCGGTTGQHIPIQIADYTALVKSAFLTFHCTEAIGVTFFGTGAGIKKVTQALLRSSLKIYTPTPVTLLKLETKK